MHTVAESDTAAAVGSGDVPALATPRLIAWMEAATVRAAAPFMRAGETTVGVSVRIRHRRATSVGGEVTIRVLPPDGADGQRLVFRVEAADYSDHSSGAVVAMGEIERAVVDRETFLESLGSGWAQDGLRMG